MRLLELTFGPGGVTLRQLAAGCEFGLVEDGVVFMSRQVCYSSQRWCMLSCRLNRSLQRYPRVKAGVSDIVELVRSVRGYQLCR